MTRCRLFQLAFTWLLRVPRRLAQVAAIVMGTITWAIASETRARVRRNLAHIPTLAADPQRLNRVTRQSFCQLALNYLDLFAPPALTQPTWFHEHVVAEGVSVFEEAVQRGKGVILLTLHTASFEATSYRLAEIVARPMLVPVEAIDPPELYDLVSQARARCGFTFERISEGATLRAMIATLRAGNLVLMPLDRDVLHTGMMLPLFGVPTRIPVGPVALARLTGAPLLFALPWREGLRGYRGSFIAAPVTIDATTRGDAAVGAALSGLLPICEEYIRAHPAQWLASFAEDLWEQPLEVQAMTAAFTSS